MNAQPTRLGENLHQEVNGPNLSPDKVTSRFLQDHPVVVHGRGVKHATGRGDQSGYNNDEFS